MLVSGSSQGVTLGGVIPLGNVISGNTGNGLEISGTAAGVVSWNSFIGQVAFGGIAPNQKNGILITSTNPGFQKNDESTHNTIRTCLVGGNKGNGIEIGGAANGVQIIDTAVGTNASISSPIPNKGSGIVIGGTSHNIAIGGFRPTVEGFDGNFGVHVGGNRGYGIEVRELAHDVVIYNTAVGIGTGETAGAALSLAARLPNLRGGIIVDAGVTNVTIGGKLNERDAFSNAIAFNGGDGIKIVGASGISVLGSIIESNTGGGVTLQGGENNQIGESGNANTIVTNAKWGVYASGSLAGSTVQGNEIRGNRGNGVVLRAAQGLLVGGTASGSGNTIARNKAFGLLAIGNCSGSTVEGNTIVRNGAGNVNVVRAGGLVVYKLVEVRITNKSAQPASMTVTCTVNGDVVPCPTPQGTYEVAPSSSTTRYHDVEEGGEEDYRVSVTVGSRPAVMLTIRDKDVKALMARSGFIREAHPTVEVEINKQGKVTFGRVFLTKDAAP
jgi:hypothetical protein